MRRAGQAETRGIGRAGPVAGQPEPAPVEGVGRQLDERSFARVAPRYRHAGDEGLRRRGEEAVEATVVAAERRHDDRDGCGVRAVVDRVLDPGDQRGVRTAFDERPVAVRAGGPHGLVESDGLADVAVPVVGVERGAVDEFTGDGGEERRPAGARLDSGDGFEQLLANRFHRNRMGGVVDVDPAGPDLQRLALVDQPVECGPLAGHDDGRAAVHRGDADAVVEARQQLGGPVLAARQRDHPRWAGQRDQQPAAQCDHARRVAQGQRARDAGRRDLTL